MSSITQYKAILHSILKTEEEWNYDVTIIPENQIVYATIPETSSENYLDIYMKIGDGKKTFAELPKASLSVSDINDLVYIFDVRVNDISVVENGIARIRVPESASDVEYKNENNPDVSNVKEGLDIALSKSSFPAQEGQNGKFLKTNGEAVEWADAVAQISDFPRITEENADVIVQYTGESNPTYQNGYFYKAILGEEHQFIITDVNPEPESGPESLKVYISDYTKLSPIWDENNVNNDLRNFNFRFYVENEEHKIDCIIVKLDQEIPEVVGINSEEELANNWGITVDGEIDWESEEELCLSFSVFKDEHVVLSHWENIEVQTQPIVNDSEIVIKQGEEVKGRFTLNQPENLTIELETGLRNLDCGWIELD